MRAVLYTVNLEPITVISLNAWLARYLEEYKRVTLPLPVQMPRYYGPSIEDSEILRTVDIWSEEFVYRKCKSVMLFTVDEVSALLLKSDFLPGQQAELNDRRDQAFAKGFFEALTMFRS